MTPISAAGATTREYARPSLTHAPTALCITVRIPAAQIATARGAQALPSASPLLTRVSNALL